MTAPALWTVTRRSGRHEPARLLYSGPDRARAYMVYDRAADALRQGDVEMRVNGEWEPRRWIAAPTLRRRW